MNWTGTTLPGSYTLTATYDNLYRLTQLFDGSVSDSTAQNYYYSYDKAGNRLSWGNQNETGTSNLKPPTSAPDTTLTNQYASYNAGNRMVTETTAMSDNWRQLTPLSGQSTNITKEPNGNATQDLFGQSGSAGYYAKTAYTNDDANHLTSYHNELNDPGQSGFGALGFKDDGTYHYDRDGRRIDWHSTFVHGYNFGWALNYGTPTTTTNYKQYEYVASSAVAERSNNGTVPVWYRILIAAARGSRGRRTYTL